MIAVLAGNIEEYYNYCKEAGYSRADLGRKVFYATRESIRGRHVDNYVVVGTFIERRDAEAVALEVERAMVLAPGHRWQGGEYAG